MKLSFLIFLIFLISCSDDSSSPNNPDPPSPSNNSKKLKTKIDKYNNGARDITNYNQKSQITDVSSYKDATLTQLKFKIVFSYNNKDKLIESKILDDGVLKPHLIFNYENDRLSKVSEYDYSDGNPNGRIDEVMTFQFNNDKSITSTLIGDNGNGTKYRTSNYTIDDNNRITKIERDNHSYPTYKIREIYIYDNLGRLVTEKIYSNNNPFEIIDTELKLIETTNYEYDDKINPLDAIHKVLNLNKEFFPTIGENAILTFYYSVLFESKSINNIIKATLIEENKTEKSLFEYNYDEDYPIEMIDKSEQSIRGTTYVEETEYIYY